MGTRSSSGGSVHSRVTPGSDGWANWGPSQQQTISEEREHEHEQERERERERDGVGAQHMPVFASILCEYIRVYHDLRVMTVCYFLAV